jgi:hypothetical protein
MSRLPQLEAQLVAAAARPRARRRLRVAGAAALAVAAWVALALLLAPTSKPREQPAQPPETVPARTLVKARALAKLPRPLSRRVAGDKIAAVAKQAMARTPYPPGMSDHFDFFAHRGNLQNNVLSVYHAVEAHAYCLWIQYWVRGADRASATAVREQTPYWPTQRGDDDRLTYWQRKIVTAARTGDVGVIQAEANASCSEVR